MILRGEVLSYLMGNQAGEKSEEIADLLALIRERDPELARTFALEVELDARLVQAEFASPVLAEGVLASFLRTHGPAAQNPER